MKFINKFSTLVLVIIISGCSTPGTLPWTYAAEDYEIRNYYDSESLYETCRTWDWAWDKGRIRGFVKQSLKRRGLSPYYCSNPELDALKQIQKNTTTNRYKSSIVCNKIGQTTICR